MLIKTTLGYQHIPDFASDIILNIYNDFYMTILTKSYATDFIRVEKGVLQGDSLSPLLFNMVINTFIQHIKKEEYTQLGYSFHKAFYPHHWFQFADDAAVITGQGHENQILLNAFSRWCTWANMKIRVDKCHSFSIKKIGSTSKQVLPKLYIKNELIPPIKIEEEFKYFGRYFNYSMDNKTHKELVIDQAKDIFAKIDALPLHPKNKIMLYSRYLLSKVSWHLTVADLTKTWVEQNLDSLYTYYLRLWLEIPPCGTLSNLCQNKSKFGLNVISFSMKHTQCQTVLRNCLSKSPNEDLKYIHKDLSNHVNIQYDHFRSTREVLKKVRDDESNRITNELI